MEPSSRTLEMFALIERYYSCNASQKSFCEIEGLKLSTFQYWITRYKKHQQKHNGTTPAPRGFVELQPEPVIPTSGIAGAIELRYPNGVTLSLAVPDTKLIKELIQL